MRFRCFVLSTLLAGVASVSSGQQNPILQWEFDGTNPYLKKLGWDTEGRGAAARNLLKLPEGLRLAAKINGGTTWIPTYGRPTIVQYPAGGVTYRIDMGDGITLVWTITEETGAVLAQDFSVVEAGQGRVDALQLQFLFDPLVTPTAIVPGSWDSDPDNFLRPPLVISAADSGQMYLEAPAGAVIQGVLAGERTTAPFYSYMGLNLARPPYTVRLRPIYLLRPALVSSQLAWDLARRGWWNAFHPSAHWTNQYRDVPSGILANNVISVPCALALQFPADSAFWIPELVPGISAMTQVRRAIEWWLDLHTTQGKGVEGCLEPQVPPGTPPSRRYLLDGNPGVLIAAWDYVEATQDVVWLEQRYDKLQAVSSFLEARRGNDGLVLCDNNGLPNDLTSSADRACGWFDVVASGHKDAYVNAFVYRAWRGMATLAARLGRSADQAHYTSLANDLKASYRPVFYDPTVGWLGWWVDTSGTRHTYSSIVVNGLAIEYGLIDPVEGRDILQRLRAKMAAVGFTRFDLGVPHVLEPILPGDYVPMTFGAPQANDGSDTLGVYENGGITAGHVLHFLAAHYVVGDPGPAEEILWPMLHRLHVGGFQSGGPRTPLQAIDWTTWNGAPSGYEGMLADVYRLPQAVFLREPAARQRFYAHLYPGGSVPPGAPTPPDPPADPPPTCANVKPYDGSGVTAAWEEGENGPVVVTSGDKYWRISGDPMSGMFTAAGFIDDLPDWSTAPRVGGLRPWDCEGVSAVSRNVVGGGLHMISFDRWWELRANGSWGIGDTLQTLWAGPNGPQPVGNRLPWTDPGITASWAAVDGTSRTYVSRDLYWRRSWNGTAWIWSQGYVSTLPGWASAPRVDTLLPWESDGVTAAFRATGRLWILNKDKYWRLDEGTGAWQSGRLVDIWAAAPPACGTPPQGVIPPTDAMCPGNN
jgi:hypothetical protein